MLDLTLLVHIGIPGSNAQLFLFYGIIGVIPHKGRSLGLIDLDDFSGNPVQKIPVVGDNENGSLIIKQVGLQPGDRVHIQMVRRLV